MKRILVLGGGFAGLWSAVGAACKLAALKISRAEVGVTLVDRYAAHNIRVRNYESDLSDVCVPFDDVLAPIGIERIEATVESIDCNARQVHTSANGALGTRPLSRSAFQRTRPAIAVIGRSSSSRSAPTWTVPAPRAR